MNAAAEKMIAELRLEPLAHEGGFFRQVWVSTARVVGGRAAASNIWFLLTPEDFSAWHRVDAEETWQWCAGDEVSHWQLGGPAGGADETKLGHPLALLVVPAGNWQAARLTPGGRHGWALVTCTLTPAWAAAGFELGRRAALTRKFPAAAGIIAALTR